MNMAPSPNYWGRTVAVLVILGAMLILMAAPHRADDQPVRHPSATMTSRP